MKEWLIELLGGVTKARFRTELDSEKSHWKLKQNNALKGVINYGFRFRLRPITTTSGFQYQIDIFLSDEWEVLKDIHNPVFPYGETVYPNVKHLRFESLEAAKKHLKKRFGKKFILEEYIL